MHADSIIYIFGYFTVSLMVAITFSASQPSVTYLCTVSSAAMSMAVEPITSRSLEVSWTPPNTTDWNGPLKEIIIIYGEAEDNTTEQEKVISIEDLVEPDDLIGTTEIDMLTPFTEYYFIMVLVNEAGEGPYSEQIAAVTLQDGENLRMHM